MQVSNGSLVFTHSGNSICIAQLDQFEFSMHFLIELLSNPLFKVTETTNTYFMVEVEGLVFIVEGAGINHCYEKRCTKMH